MSKKYTDKSKYQSLKNMDISIDIINFPTLKWESNWRMERIEGASSLVHSLASSLVVRSHSPSFLPHHSSFTVVRHSSFTVAASSLRRRPSFILVNLRMPSFTLLHPGTEWFSFQDFGDSGIRILGVLVWWV